MTDTAPTITIDPNKLIALMQHFNECPLPPDAGCDACDTYARSDRYRINREFARWLEGELDTMDAAWPEEQELGDATWAEFATHFLMVTLFQERERVTAWLTSEVRR